MAIRVLDVERDGAVMPSGALPPGADVRMMVWPGIGATTGSLHYVRCDAGYAGPAHVHERSDDVGYVIAGEGFMVEWKDGIEIARYPFREGNVLFVEPGTVHSHIATTPCVMIGGPCPPEAEAYRRYGMTW